MRITTCVLVLASAAAGAACNSLLGVDDVTAAPDALQAPAPSCAVAPSLGILSTSPASSSLTHQADGTPDLVIVLNADQQPDHSVISDGFTVLLRDNHGGHGVVNAPGTYALLAGDATFETCAVCVVIFGDLSSTTGKAAQTYVAKAQGTLTLTKADATGITGRMTDLALRHVNDPVTDPTDSPDGCATQISDVEINLTYATQ